MRDQLFCEFFIRKNISDLANADRGESRIEKGFGKKDSVGLKRKIASVVGAVKVRCFPRKGTRDNSAHSVFVHKHFTRLATYVVKLSRGDDRLVGGYLKYAVGRGVENKRTRSQMLLSEIGNHLSARIGQIAQHASSAKLCEPVNDIGWESVGEGWKSAVRYLSRYLPVPDSRILTLGCLGHSRAERGRRVRSAKEGQTVDISDTHLDKIGDLQLGGGGNAPQRKRSDVTESLGVGRLSGPQAVKDYYKGSFNIHSSAQILIESSKASVIISVKEFCLSIAGRESPVTIESEMVHIARAFLPALAAFI